MTRFSPRTASRSRAGGLAATALLLAAGSLTVAATTAPPRAEAPVFALGGPAGTALHPYAEGGGEPRRTAVAITVANPAGGGKGYEGDFAVTFDLTGAGGVADLDTLALDAGPGITCGTTGPRTAVCTGHGLPPGLTPLADLLLGAAEGSEPGDSGTIRVTGEAGGAAFTPFTARLTVGGPDLVMRELPFEHELTPGHRQPAPITFTNRGSRAAEGVVLTLRYSRGLDIPQRYSNCAYATDAPDLPGGGWTTARCSVEGSFEAGGTYTLAAPLTLEATTRAYRDTFVYGIHESGADRRAPAARSLAHGADAVLRAVQLKQPGAARAVDLEPGDNERRADFRTENTADFVAYGDTASGAVGDTVTADIGFRNDGPAWIGRLRSGGSVAAVDFTVPPGATVVSAPAGCRAARADGAYREDGTGPAPRYVCPTSTTVRDGGGLDLTFGLRIDEVRTGAVGRVTVRGPELRRPGLPFDPRAGNDTARVVLNGAGGGWSGGPGDGPGEPSSAPTDAPGDDAPGTSGSAARGAEGATAATGGGDTDGGGGSGGSGGPGADSAAGNGGSLASTGSSTAVLASGAAAVTALTAGLALFTAAGRRRRV
ncbi:peptidase [Streptomyces sp. cmx-18-6]|uniref:peptidase n=1 Tax=Streptomyces sp. cmx-18-6 TaxID=2790930 RepID=UPI003980C607